MQIFLFLFILGTLRFGKCVNCDIRTQTRSTAELDSHRDTERVPDLVAGAVGARTPSSILHD